METTEIDLQSPELYINRELSLIEFNRRVLAQALDEDVPLLERLRYLCISSTNLDEFFEIRVAGLKEMAEAGSAQTFSDNMAAPEALRAIAERVQGLVAEQYRVLNELLIPAMAEEQINFVRRSKWNKKQKEWLYEYFSTQLLPVISPLGLDPAHPFPRILNKSLNFILRLAGKDAFGRNIDYAVVQAPRSLPRVIALPEEIGGAHSFVFLSSIIHHFVDELFPGMEIKGCYQFRVTRNGDLFVDEEEVDDLRRALEGELQSRRYGDAVRIEVDHRCPDGTVQFLLDQFGLTEQDTFRVEGPVNLGRLMQVPDLVERSDLKFKPFNPGTLKASDAANMFDAIRRRDLIVHHPYENFSPVLDLLNQAALDPHVLSVRQTLYRTGPDSAVVDALVAAARAGKEVTVVVELRARFDEQANLNLAQRLQEAGAHVVYGVVGYKTHAKMLHIVRRENNKLRHYVHLSTGNYHPRTARVYTDYGYFTCNNKIGQDVYNVFMQLTSLGKLKPLKALLTGPFNLLTGILENIEGEIKKAKKGEPARIVAKMNGLVEAQIIQALYRASQAGVDIDLIVRGMCALRPGVPGVSENIRVRSIIGRFLEHTRVFYFHNGGDYKLYLGSADMMDRNLYRRVEINFPIVDEKLRTRICAELEEYLYDNTQAWLLQPDGSYQRAEPGKETPRSAQRRLLEGLSE